MKAAAARVVPMWLPMWALIGLLGLMAAAQAVAREDLYEATVPVADRSAASRAEAVRAALGEVLVQLTGDPAAPAQPAAAPLLANPDRYLQQYQYEGDPAAGGLFFRAGFAGAALEDAMRRQGLGLWGLERPPLLVWLAVDAAQRRYLLGGEDTDGVLNELQAAARRQGVTLVLPLFDLEDQSKVTFSAVQGGDLEQLMPASQRYQPQAVLVGSLQQSGADWTGRWALRFGGNDSRWQTAAAPLAGTLDQALGQAAGRLTARVPVPTSSAEARLQVRVEGVASLADYARVGEYLGTLPLVRSAELVAVSGQQLEYVVEVQGGVEGLDRAVAAGVVLEAAPDRADSAGAASYRLRH